MMHCVTVGFLDLSSKRQQPPSIFIIPEMSDYEAINSEKILIHLGQDHPNDVQDNVLHYMWIQCEKIISLN